MTKAEINEIMTEQVIKPLISQSPSFSDLLSRNIRSGATSTVSCQSIDTYHAVKRHWKGFRRFWGVKSEDTSPLTMSLVLTCPLTCSRVIHQFFRQGSTEYFKYSFGVFSVNKEAATTRSTKIITAIAGVSLMYRRNTVLNKLNFPLQIWMKINSARFISSPDRLLFQLFDYRLGGQSGAHYKKPIDASVYCSYWMCPRAAPPLIKCLMVSERCDDSEKMRVQINYCDWWNCSDAMQTFDFTCSRAFEAEQSFKLVFQREVL